MIFIIWDIYKLQIWGTKTNWEMGSSQYQFQPTRVNNLQHFLCSCAHVPSYNGFPIHLLNDGSLYGWILILIPSLKTQNIYATSCILRSHCNQKLCYNWHQKPFMSGKCRWTQQFKFFVEIQNSAKRVIWGNAWLITP